MNQPPNILFIVADHHTWQAVAGRSPARTPNLNRLAEQGLLFERSYTPVSVCCPARAMLITGAYPWHNGVYNQVHGPTALSRDMKPDVVTYPQRLRDVGYQLGYCGKWHASHVRGPMDFGFHMHSDLLGVGAAYIARHNLPEHNLYAHYRQQFRIGLSGERHVRWPGSEPFLMWACDESSPEATHTHFLAEHASRTMGDLASGDKPWHLEVHFPEPHDAYRPLRQFLNNYSADEIELPVSYYQETFADKPRLLEREASLWAELSEADFKEGVRHFYAYCEQVDHYVGRVLRALDETGQADNTLVVFTSDHGDMVGAHRQFIKGWTPYEETHRTPMIARWPGVIPAGSKTEALVHLHDWAHTFVSIAGAEPLPYADGKDLLSVLSDPQASGPDHLLNVYYGGEFLYTQRILIGRRYKYVFNGFDWDEFYDLERDPHELRNAVDDEACRENVASAREDLWQLMRQFDDPYAAGNRYGAPRYLERPH